MTENARMEIMLLRALTNPRQLVGSIATHAAMDVLGRQKSSPHSSVHYEKQVGELTSEITQDLLLGFGPVKLDFDQREVHQNGNGEVIMTPKSAKE